jgi:hypothetical protein
MRKRVQIALAVLLVVIVGGIAWLVWPAREPVYQGKGLRVWLQETRWATGLEHGELNAGGVGVWVIGPRGDSDGSAEEAVRQIGTNANRQSP